MEKFLPRSRWPATCGWFTVLVASICLFGWLTHDLRLASFLDDQIMMAPTTAICFLALASVLIGFKTWSAPDGAGRRLRNLTVVAVVGLNLLESTSFLTGRDSIVDRFLSGTVALFGVIPIGRMSVVTAALFLLSCAGLYHKHWIDERRRSWFFCCTSLASILVVIASGMLIIGYSYGVPFFYHENFVPPAFPTAICFFTLNLGIFATVGRESRWFGEIFGSSIFARQVRSLIPGITGFILLEGWFDAQGFALFQNEAVNHSILSLLLVSLVFVVIFSQSKRISMQLALAAAQTKAKEMDLEASDARFRQAVMNAPFPVILHAEDGQVLAISQGWTYSSGYALEEIPSIGDWSTMAYGENHAVVQQDIEALYGREERVDEGEYLVRCKDGSNRTWDFSSAPIGRLSDGRRAVISMAMDVTERNRLRDNMQRIERLDSLGVLAGGIAHDFNNLLAGLFGYLEMARDASPPDSQATGYLQKASTVFTRAKDLTHQLLTFSKGGAPKRKTGQLGDRIESIVKFALSGSNVESVFRIPSDLWPCDYDENQIAQVLDNLIINAQQAMPRGGTITISIENVTLGVSEHPSLREGDYLRISIADTGEGIPPDSVKRIFDPFFTTKQHGSGLGLATCYSIVQKHEGCIDVESDLGNGTTFRVLLPASHQIPISEVAVGVGQHEGKRGMILVMDDEPFIREILAVLLGGMGYVCLLAKNGEEALRKFGEFEALGQPILAAFFDLTIPGGMGGKEAVRLLRTTQPDIPVFASSGFSDDPIMANPKAFGFTDSIGKPFLKSDLVEMLNRHLPESGLTSPGGRSIPPKT